MITEIDPYLLPIDQLMATLCSTPYHGHAHGCGNVGKKEGCPPQPLLMEYLDFERQVSVIYTQFAVGEFAERMRVKHPEWTERSYPDTPRKGIERVESIVDKLHHLHPDWPDEYFPKPKGEWISCREWYNPRRWQGTARKAHRSERERYLSENPGSVIDSCPEAHGVNLTGLMAQLGIELAREWPPVHSVDNMAYLISLGGHPRTNEQISLRP